MGAHRDINRKKKDKSKVRRERRDEKRVKNATKLLGKAGLETSAQNVKTVIKDYQTKNRDLQNRISKKKERKLLKSTARQQRKAAEMETESEAVSSKKSKKSTKPKINDVEMPEETAEVSTV